jgi:crossover junction endodeoxyribonuclease RuvC
MRILGVDPGTVVIGYGIIDGDQGEMTHIANGAITCKQRSPMGERLSFLYDELQKVIAQYHPEALAIETPFVGENVKSALAIGKGQAIAILAASQHGLPVFEYSPAQVKHHVAGYGASTKEQIQQMVKLELELEDIPRPADAADALAVAICHLREARLKEILDAGR